LLQNKQNPFFDYEKMQPFGGIGYVAKRLKFQKKFTPKAFPMSFIGYPANHALDNYKMYNHVTRQAVITRDISKWEKFNRDIISELVPLFDGESVAQHKLMNLMKNAEETTSVKEIEFNDDEVDKVELEVITKDLVQTRNTGVPNLIPNDDDSDDEDNVPILGPRLVDNNNMPEHHVITDRKKEDDRSNDEDNASENDGDDASGNENFEPDDNGEQVNDKVHRELAKLDADLNDIDMNEGIRTRSQVYFVDVATDEVVFNAEAVKSEGNAPKTFKQAEQNESKDQWMGAAQREIDNFMKRDAWAKMK
jgi:hypothetical protein